MDVIISTKNSPGFFLEVSNFWSLRAGPIEINNLQQWNDYNLSLLGALLCNLNVGGHLGLQYPAAPLLQRYRTICLYPNHIKGVFK